MQLHDKLRTSAVGCCLLFVLCAVACHPWAAMGIADDWSYIRSSQLLAETGRIHYNGWSMPVVGWQLYLSAASIKLLGFSFTAARVPIMLLGLLTVFVMQRTLVRFGIGERSASLGTLTFALSPLFLPLSMTAMTDIPGFFSVLACLYGCLRALQSRQDSEAARWIYFAVAVNAVCGTSRQIAWVGVLVLVPSTLFLLRSRRNVLLRGMVATALGFIFVFAVLHWFEAQPYTPLDSQTLPPLHLEEWKMLGRNYFKSLLEMGLLLIPISLPFMAAARRLSLRGVAALVGISLVCLAGLFHAAYSANVPFGHNPFDGDWLGPHAMFDTQLLQGSAPVVLGPRVMLGLSALALVSVLCVGATVLLTRSKLSGAKVESVLPWRQVGFLLGPIGVVYLLLLSHRGMVAIFDRYLLTPIFLALVMLLLFSQQYLRDRLSVATYVATGVVAFYGILCTHNVFALARARATLADEVRSTGVPLSQVDLGWEMNGWNELHVSPNINDSHILRPAGTYHPYEEPKGPGCREAFYGNFPHLAPQYGVSFDPGACGGAAGFAPVSYATWPLRHRTMLYVVRYPTPRGPESDYPAPVMGAAVR